MIRPRHRAKSNLLWKMLGVAGVINLVLWPVLVHEGVFAGIRQEILIPVTLVSLPPSHKLPDTLQAVGHTAHASPVSAPKVAPPVRQARKPASRQQVPTVQSASVKQTQVASVSVIPKTKTQKSHLTLAPHVAALVQLASHHTPIKPVREAHAQKAQISAHPTRDAAAASILHPALAARIARAKRLEAEGHQVAELIAQQRADREARLPSSDVPITPVAVTQSVPVPQATEKVISAPQSRPRPVSQDTPTVAVSKSYPSVPDSMMKSAWHATFRGQFTVHRDGTATVRMVSSTGVPVLDRRAIQAARRWQFRPARKNGVAVVSTQSFAFEYDVHPTH